MMQYQVRAQAVEAERVVLAGQEMAAVAVNGKAHLVPAEVLDVFFARVAEPAPTGKPEGKEALEQGIGFAARVGAEVAGRWSADYGGACGPRVPGSTRSDEAAGCLLASPEGHADR